jgi:uroporphyrinogen decarboxylase
LVFQIPEQAFQLSWPTGEEIASATPKEMERLTERWFHINELIIERYNWSAIAADVSYGPYQDFITRAKKRLGEKVLIYCWNGQGTYWMPTGDEMMDFIVMLFEQPDLLHQNARRKMEASIELAKRQVDQGADFICINSDYGFNQGPFISPKHFSEFVTPYLTEIVSAIHSLGVKAILHSDGDLRLILDQLSSTGIDGYQSIDPQGNMDIKAVKAQYGKDLILMGNVKSSALQDDNEEEIRASVRYAITLGKPGGKYIFSTSNCIFDGMPLANYHLMLDEYEKYAYYQKETTT